MRRPGIGGPVILAPCAGASDAIARTAYDDRLLVWDSTGRTLTSLDPRMGSVISTLSLPEVSILEASRLRSGNIVAASDDGRVVRLEPRS